MREYFWLKQDTRKELFAAYIPESVVSGQSRITGDISYLKRITLFETSYSANEETQFDILDRSLFMVSKKIKEVFDLFLPYIDYREICVADTKQRCSHYYYTPSFHFSDLKNEMINSSSSHNERTIKVFANQNLTDEIIKVRGTSGTFILVSLMIAEAMLRMDAKNVRLIPVEIECK